MKTLLFAAFLLSLPAGAAPTTSEPAAGSTTDAPNYSLGASGVPTDTSTGMTAGPEAKTRKGKNQTKAKAKKDKKSGEKTANQYGTASDNFSAEDAAPASNPTAIPGEEPSGNMGITSGPSTGDSGTRGPARY